MKVWWRTNVFLKADWLECLPPSMIGYICGRRQIYLFLSFFKFHLVVGIAYISPLLFVAIQSMKEKKNCRLYCNFRLCNNLYILIKRKSEIHLVRILKKIAFFFLSFFNFVKFQHSYKWSVKVDTNLDDKNVPLIEEWLIYKPNK